MREVRVVRRMRRSELDALHVCMYRAREIYERGFIDQSEPSQRGQAFHEVVRRYILRLVRAGLPSDHEEAKAAFKEGIAISMCPASLVAEVHILFFERFVPGFELDLDAYVTAEELQFDDRFTWVPDLVYAYPDRLKIRDWKTFWRGLTQEQANAEFQPLFYLRQAAKVWPNFPLYEFEFVFVRLGSVVSVILTPEQLDAIDGQVEAVLLKRELAIQTGEWPATPGEHCRFCRLRCPIIDDPRRVPVRAETREDAEALAGEWLVLEQRLAAVKTALSGYVDRDGPVIVNGEEFKYRARTSRRYPMAEVMAVLEAHELADRAHAIEISATALAPLLSKRHGSPALLDDLEGVRRDTQSWQLRHHKAGAFDDDEISHG